MTSQRLAETWLTTRQAAVWLNVNRLTVQRWVNSGKLTGERIGNITLIPKEQVRSLVQERRLLYGQTA